VFWKEVYMSPPHRQNEGEHATASSRPQKPYGALEFLKSLSGSAGILVGMAFVGGWLYWATYYTAFGLNPLVLDFPIAVVSVSPLQVIVRDLRSEQGLVVGVLILVVIVCIALGILFAHWRTYSHPYATVPLVVLAVVMSVSALELGAHDAELDSGCQSRLPNVTFQLITPPDPGEPPFPCDTATCQLILHSNNTYHYFVAPSCSPGKSAVSLPGAGFPTADIPDSQIRVVNIQRRLGW
jgi:hypothetical protein